jgi:hypothetical protein
MPLDNLYPNNNLVVFGQGLSHGVPELLDEVPDMPGDGWDTLKRTYLIQDGERPLLQTALGHYFPRGTKDADLTMWITDVTGRRYSQGVHVAQVTYRGILSARGFKISTSAAVATQSGENITAPDDDSSPGVPGSGVVRSKLEVAENQVTCDVSYISLGMGPRTHLTGRNETPPSAPTPPTSWWSWLADPTYHYPHGWVLMASDGEGLPGVDHADICLITDRYQYIHEISP